MPLTKVPSEMMKATGLTPGTYAGLTFDAAGRATASPGPFPASPNIQYFVSSGNWVKPANARFVDIYLMGGGAGGGSGRKCNASENGAGGGGGGGAGYMVARVLAADLAATESVTIGLGGTGGVSRTVTGDGQAGQNGGSTVFGSLYQHTGAQGAGGGTATAGNAGGGGLSGNTGGAASSVFSTGIAGVPNVLQSTSNQAAGAGASGGGVTSANAQFPGNTGGRVSFLSPFTGLIGGSAGVTSGNRNGGNGVDAPSELYGKIIAASGGGSGASSVTSTVNAGSGGNGGYPGGGGGGGGAAASGAGGSGAGGTGGNGYAFIVTYF